MKILSCCAVSLCIAGIVNTVPGRAQEAISSLPDVRVETKVVQVPEVRVETQVDTTPEVRIKEQLRTLLGTTSGNVGEIQAAAQNLQQYALAQNYQNFNAFYSPEMAKKTREIALLRQMLALKLSARDIEKALPLLKEMKDADKVVPVKPEQAVDEEIQKLLEARPGDPMPPSSSEALRDAATGSRTRKVAIWDKMGQLIGKEKAAGIRAMLRSENTIVWMTSPSRSGLFTSPRALAPLTAPDFPFKTDKAPKAKPAPAPDSDTTPPDAPEPAKPVEVDGDPTKPARPRSPQSRVETDDAASTERAEASAEARRVAREARQTARTQGTTRAAPPATVYTLPGGRTLNLDMNGNRTRVISGMYGQATLDELISLFERKLAAMRH